MLVKPPLSILVDSRALISLSRSIASSRSSICCLYFSSSACSEIFFSILAVASPFFSSSRSRSNALTAVAMASCFASAPSGLFASHSGRSFSAGLVRPHLIVRGMLLGLGAGRPSGKSGRMPTGQTVHTVGFRERWLDPCRVARGGAFRAENSGESHQELHNCLKPTSNFAQASQWLACQLENVVALRKDEGL